MAPFRPPHRSAHDIVEEEARRRDSRRDDTDPPRPPAPAPIDVEVTPQARPSKAVFHLPRPTLGNLKDFGYLVAAVVAAVTWFQNRASKQDVADAQKADAAACAAAIASALAPIPPRIKALEERARVADKRWDALDDFHAKAPALNRPNTTKPPKFGPNAQAHGATAFDHEDD